jgi:hypothetical protein
MRLKNMIFLWFNRASFQNGTIFNFLSSPSRILFVQICVNFQNFSSQHKRDLMIGFRAIRMPLSANVWRWQGQEDSVSGGRTQRVRIRRITYSPIIASTMPVILIIIVRKYLQYLYGKCNLYEIKGMPCRSSYVFVE